MFIRYCLNFLPLSIEPMWQVHSVRWQLLTSYFHFHPDILLCSYLSRMARGDHQDDDDDFMELPRQNRATGRTTDGDEVTVHPPPQPPFPHMFFNVMLSLQSSDRD